MFIPSGIKEMFLAGDVMTYDPIVITKDSDLAEAALIMMGNRISGIPVIGSRADLAGIIRKTDIIRALAGSYNTLIKDKFDHNIHTIDHSNDINLSFDFLNFFNNIIMRGTGLKGI